jgi:leucyl aminopeptidase
MIPMKSDMAGAAADPGCKLLQMAKIKPRLRITALMMCVR